MNLRNVAVALALAALAAGPASQESSAQQLPVFVEFRVQKAPTGALVGDTAASLGYELHITNVTAAPLTLRRVEVLDERDGRVLLTLQDSTLLREVARPGPAVSVTDRARIDAGLRAVVFLWVPISKSDPPASVRQRLTFQRALPDTTSQILEGASVRVSTDIPVIGPPLRGEWLAANGPSNASGHRRSMVTLGGSMAIGQRYAIDYLQVDEKGQTFQGDRSKNANFYAQGEEVLSVADGVVVQTKDSIPENVPGINSRAVPITLETVAGNNIVVDLGNSRFALYAHLQPGSLRVRVGDRVQRGQVLGLVGNSGNSTEPHLHFHLADGLARGTSTLGAEGIPYVHEQLEVLGRCALAAAITCTRSAPVTRAGIMPAQNQLVRFAPPAAVAPPPDYSAPAGAPYTAESVTVPTPVGHTLAGTLTLPRGASRTRPVGVLVTITGSGAQDRDEGMAQIGYQPFRQFADSLSRRGFAVLRMDDRGTGQSKGTWRGSTSADFAEDIRAGLAYLRTRPEIDARRMGLIGHSEGALIANIVADQEPALRGIVLLGGVARPAHEVLVFQMKNLINHNTTLSQTQKDSAIAAIPARIDSMMARDPWMDFFLKHDPAATSRRVKTPAVLILTGANDQQADPKQVPAWEAAFKAAGNRDVTAQVLPGLNHLFAADADGFPGNYTKLPRPVRVESSAIGLVVNWVSARFRP